MHVGEELGKRQTAVTGKGPAQPRLPGVTCNLAADTGGDDQRFQHDRSGFRLEGLIVKLEDGDQGESGEQTVEVLHAEEHGNGVEPGGREADRHGAHDRDGDHLLWPRHLLGHVGGGVKAGKGPIGIDQSDDEGNAVLAPPGIVHKVSENKPGLLMGRCFGRHGDQDDEEGHQGDVESGGGDEG